MFYFQLFFLAFKSHSFVCCYFKKSFRERNKSLVHLRIKLLFSVSPTSLNIYLSFSADYQIVKCWKRTNFKTAHTIHIEEYTNKGFHRLSLFMSPTLRPRHRVLWVPQKPPSCPYLNIVLFFLPRSNYYSD